jgi:hypothetical protein
MVKLTNVICVIVTMKIYIGRDTGNEGRKARLFKLSNVPSVTVKIKKYPERNSGHYRDDSSD